MVSRQVKKVDGDCVLTEERSVIPQIPTYSRTRCANIRLRRSVRPCGLVSSTGGNERARVLRLLKLFSTPINTFASSRLRLKADRESSRIHEITVYGARLARLKSFFDPRDDRALIPRPTHLSRSGSGRKGDEKVEEKEDKIGERPARSFNQTRVLIYAYIPRASRTTDSLLQANYRPSAVGRICVPTGHERGRSTARRLLFDHRRDLRIVDPLSNHSNRRRPAGLIGGVYARGRVRYPSRGLPKIERLFRERERDGFRLPTPTTIALPSPIMPSGNGRPRGPDYLRAARKHADVV